MFAEQIQCFKFNFSSTKYLRIGCFHPSEMGARNAEKYFEFYWINWIFKNTVWCPCSMYLPAKFFTIGYKEKNARKD